VSRDVSSYVPLWHHWWAHEDVAAALHAIRIRENGMGQKWNVEDLQKIKKKVAEMFVGRSFGDYREFWRVLGILGNFEEFWGDLLNFEEFCWFWGFLGVLGILRKFWGY
jgi:hypothetical protein